MDLLEETIEATVSADGQLTLARPSQFPAGPVRVTIHPVEPVRRRGLADVIREIAANQRARGFLGRSSEEIQAERDAYMAEDEERDRMLDAARRGGT